VVPSISPVAITFKDASEKLGKLKGVDYEAAYKEIYAELQRLEQGMEKAHLPVVPYSAQGFQTRVSPTHFDPPSTGLERFAKGTVSGLKSPALRTAVDEAAAKEDRGGIPVGVYPFAGLAEGGGALLDFAKRFVPAAK
jgi:hypothetical protein